MKNTDNYNMIPCTIQKHIVNNPSRFISNSNSCHKLNIYSECKLFFCYRVLDHDTYSAHDAIGKVYIDLNPLLVKDSPSVITGWFPVYDTMHGMC